MGTTRMAESPGRGVVDSDCRVFGLENLYVAGSSVFPTSGLANPTLTLVALALRLGDRLREVMR
jgi:choline dehydrogenase-like flavoprotein